MSQQSRLFYNRGTRRWQNGLDEKHQQGSRFALSGRPEFFRFIGWTSIIPVRTLCDNAVRPHPHRDCAQRTQCWEHEATDAHSIFKWMKTFCEAGPAYFRLRRRLENLKSTQEPPLIRKDFEVQEPSLPDTSANQHRAAASSFRDSIKRANPTSKVGKRQPTDEELKFFRRLRDLSNPCYGSVAVDDAIDHMPMHLCLVKTLLNSFVETRENGMEIGALMKLYMDIYQLPIFGLSEANKQFVATMLSRGRFRKHFAVEEKGELRIYLKEKRNTRNGCSVPKPVHLQGSSPSSGTHCSIEPHRAAPSNLENSSAAVVLTSKPLQRQPTADELQFFRRLRDLSIPNIGSASGADDDEIEHLLLYFSLVKALLSTFISSPEDGMEIGTLMILYREVYESPIFGLTEASKEDVAAILSSRGFRNHFIVQSAGSFRVFLKDKVGSLG